MPLITSKLTRPTVRRAAKQAAASAVVCRPSSRPCTEKSKNCHPETSNRIKHRNQQYSIIALTDGSGAIQERYAYSAYGELTFFNASGTVQSASAVDNRYTYTGREWDRLLGLYHFRARMYFSENGSFCSFDKLGYQDGTSLYTGYFPLSLLDPTGQECHWERHHWFPREHRASIETRCRGVGFNIDYLVTPLMRCNRQDQQCDAHGWLHNRRIPKWNTLVSDTLRQTGSCCQFLTAMAGNIAVAYADIQARFNPLNCQKGRDECYPGLNMQNYFNPPGPEVRDPIQTLCYWADLVEACREGQNEQQIQLPLINLLGGTSGVQYSPGPEVIFGGVGAACLRRILGGAAGGTATGGGATVFPKPGTEPPTILKFPPEPVVAPKPEILPIAG